MNRIKVLLFATLRQHAGARSIMIEVPEGTDIRGLIDRLGGEYPALKQDLKSALVAMNKEYAPENAVIPVDAEIALFPPVSGG